jgi:c(7)-type cytochrome triheme protein
MGKVFFVVVLVLAISGMTMAQTGVKKKRPLPHEYGRAVLKNYSEKTGASPVVFDHWLHRSKFTCRLCHVDFAFAMKTGSTGIKASDNMKGYYCGTCHNGKMVFQGTRIFESCSKKFQADDIKRCDRCHSLGKNVKREYDFAKFTERFPKERFGNGIDWEKSEADGYIKLVDFLEGVSIPRKSLSAQKDFALSPRLEDTAARATAQWPFPCSIASDAIQNLFNDGANFSCAGLLSTYPERWQTQPSLS